MTRARAGLAALSSVSSYRWLQVAVLVILAVAFVTSFESGAAGAELLGYPPEFRRAFPFVADVVAAVAVIVHGRAPSSEIRRLATAFVLVPMTLSWGSNALDHWTRAQASIPEGWPVELWAVFVVLAAGVCPVAVAALLHFMGRYSDSLTEGDRPQPCVEMPAALPAPQPAAVPVEDDKAPAAVPGRPERSRRVNSDEREALIERAAQWAASELADGRRSGRDYIRAQFADISADDAKEAARRGRALAAQDTTTQKQPVPVGGS